MDRMESLKMRLKQSHEQGVSSHTKIMGGLGDRMLTAREGDALFDYAATLPAETFGIFWSDENKAKRAAVEAERRAARESYVHTGFEAGAL